MPNTIFAILLGLLGLCAIYAAVRGGSGRQRAGWMVIALAAAIQVLNLVSQYSMLLAILTTVGLIAGLWLIRMPSGTTVDRRS